MKAVDTEGQNQKITVKNKAESSKVQGKHMLSCKRLFEVFLTRSVIFHQLGIFHHKMAQNSFQHFPRRRF